MAAGMSKRQAARNERILQTLTEDVPGNDKCADCEAPYPGWASWNLGVFLCIRCAGLHRKLGTHISKVKSLSLDTWNDEQVESIKSKGNDVTNRLYNPRRVRLDAPNDLNDFDRIVEKFIKQKYDQKLFMNANTSRQIASTTPQRRQLTGGSDNTADIADDHHKTGRKFGFSLRSTSALLPRRLRSHKSSPPLTPALTGLDDGLGNKQSRVLGSKIGNGDDAHFYAELARLREMGFKNSRQNSLALRENNSDLDRAIEQLVKLAEEDKLSASPACEPTGGELRVEKQRANAPSNNPFDAINRSVGPQRSATAPLPQLSAPTSSYNPFLQQQQQYQPPESIGYGGLDQSFQQLSMSQPQHATHQPFDAQQSQVLQHNQTGPFYGSAQSQQFTTGNPWATNSAPNPFLPQYTASPPVMYAQSTVNLSQQTPNPFYAQPAQYQATSAPPQPSNPYGPQVANQFQATTYQNVMQPQHQQYQQQPLQQSPTRLDKSSILALYNQPQSVQQPLQVPAQNMQMPQYQQQPLYGHGGQTVPGSSNNNPFPM